MLAMSDYIWLFLGGLAIVLLLTAAVIATVIQRRPLKVNLEKARKLFHLRREWLEARFFTLASQSGKPRGLEWVDCDFDNGVSYARDRHTGRLRALSAVTIRFRAIEGGGMEDNPNVGNLRAACAVFHLDGEEWSTDGRTLFNLNPAQAIQHFQQELELVE